jgi:hypothetical protein
LGNQLPSKNGQENIENAVKKRMHATLKQHSYKTMDEKIHQNADLMTPNLSDHHHHNTGNSFATEC